MRIKWLLAASVAVFVLQTSSTASAFQCPSRFAAAQAAIDKASESMMNVMDQMPKEEMALVYNASGPWPKIPHRGGKQ